MEELTPQNQVPRLDSKTKIHQLREPVPVDLQGEFFALVRKRRADLEEGKMQAPNESDLIYRIEQVLEDRDGIDDKALMRYFVSLACCKTVEALRFAESLLLREDYYEHCLALMAELEVRMHVYEELTGEPQAIIASGLGGVDDLIRLSGVAFQKNFEPWEPYQEKLLSDTLKEVCQEHGGYVEEEFMGDVYYGFCFLLPYYENIAKILEGFLNECNQYGNFLNPDCHVGNMHKLTHELIRQIVSFRKATDESREDDKLRSFFDLLNNIISPDKPEEGQDREDDKDE